MTYSPIEKNEKNILNIRKMNLQPSNVRLNKKQYNNKQTNKIRSIHKIIVRLVIPMKIKILLPLML